MHIFLFREIFLVSFVNLKEGFVFQNQDIRVGGPAARRVFEKRNFSTSSCLRLHLPIVDIFFVVG
jgi:hypothetical protein